MKCLQAVKAIVVPALFFILVCSEVDIVASPQLVLGCSIELLVIIVPIFHTRVPLLYAFSQLLHFQANAEVTSLVGGVIVCSCCLHLLA